ncbi:hypothetical protein ACTXI9_01730 [Brachybacterium alimentarium]|uniref:hypothetical protein n=1 Tax=Brachybacterium alimentarium TaxID=47845 RepID=UPI003FD20135
MTTIDRDETRRRAQGAIDAERRAAIGPFTFNKARPVLAPREVLALLDALTRAEAQSETRRQQTKYWKVRAEVFEAKMNELDRAYISEHGQRRRAEDEQDRLKNKLARRSETVSRLLEERNNAEARIQAVRDVHRHIAIETRGIDVPEHRCLDCCLHWPCPTIRALDAP